MNAREWSVVWVCVLSLGACAHAAGGAARVCRDPVRARQAIARAEAQNQTWFDEAVARADLTLLPVDPVEVPREVAPYQAGRLFEYDGQRLVTAASQVTPGGRGLARTRAGDVVLIEPRYQEVSRRGYELCGCPEWEGGGAEVPPPTTVAAYVLPDGGRFAGVRELAMQRSGDYIYYDYILPDGRRCEPPP